VRRPKVVLLDLDDTLFDHTHSSRTALGALRDAFEPFARLELDALHRIHARNLEKMHALVLRGEMSVEEARLARFRATAADCGATALDVVAIAATYRAAYQHARRSVPGALELLGAVRSRAKVAIVTNNVVAEQIEKLAHLGMTDLVDVLVISEEAGVQKPDAAIFRIALQRAGAEADDAVMIGDSWGSDVLGARAAGIRAVWLNRARLPCPGPGLCAEIQSLLPTESVLELLFGAGAA
jgi:putative hydrolase of the HAD superfamily